MAMATVLIAPETLSPSQNACPHCGNHLTLSPHASSVSEAQHRIQDLEAQVKLLNAKAAAAVDRLADYEDELRTLHSQQLQTRPQTSAGIVRTSLEEPQRLPTKSQHHGQSSLIPSFSSFFPGRRGSPQNESFAPPTPTLPAHLSVPSPSFRPLPFSNKSAPSLLPLLNRQPDQPRDFLQCRPSLPRDGRPRLRSRS